MDAAEFRRILGHWVTGVAIVAARDAEGRPCGLTANAVTALSLEPPLVLACVEKDADSHDCIHNARTFSINILSADHERLARRFASSQPRAKFDGIAYHANDAPILDDAMAWVVCRLRNAFPGGDHTIFVGEVLDGDARDDAPLVFYRGGYGRFGL